MAVIYCPDCKREMSDTASVCPGCGYPYAQKSELYQKLIRLMQNCTTSNGYLGVAELFHSIQEFQNAAALEKTCRINARACYQQEMEKARQEAEEKARQEEEARRKQEEQLERERMQREQERIKKEQEEREQQEQRAFRKKYKLPFILRCLVVLQLVSIVLIFIGMLTLSVMLILYSILISFALIGINSLVAGLCLYRSRNLPKKIGMKTSIITIILEVSFLYFIMISL